MDTSEEDATALRLRLDQVSAHLEELKLWSDTQLHLMQSRLHTQFARLQVEVAELQSVAPLPGSADYATRLEAQLRQLADRGDAVYALLRGHLDPESQDLPYSGNIGVKADRSTPVSTPEPPPTDLGNRES